MHMGDGIHLLGCAVHPGCAVSSLLCCFIPVVLFHPCRAVSSLPCCFTWLGFSLQVDEKEILPTPGEGMPAEEISRVMKELRLKRIEFGILKQKLRTVIGRPDGESDRMKRVQQRLRRSMGALKIEGDVLAQRLGLNWNGIYPGRAKQVKPDKDYTTGKPLWRAFRECESRTGGRQLNSKGRSFEKHTLPGGESFVYGKDKRKLIPKDVLQRIRYVWSCSVSVLGVEVVSFKRACLFGVCVCVFTCVSWSLLQGTQQR